MHPRKKNHKNIDLVQDLIDAINLKKGKAAFIFLDQELLVLGKILSSG